MAATAKHDLRQNYPSNDPSNKVSGSSGDEDIAAIAKQISDHAEAIYQTWKSRGLAPTEILNCHSNATAADKFDSVLTPVVSTTGVTSNKTHRRQQQNHLPAPRTTVELLAQAPTLDNNNLEKLVNNFVVEDKARLAAAASSLTLRQKSSAPSSSSSPSKTALRSSIQLALEKFETRGVDNDAAPRSSSSATASKLHRHNQQPRTQIEDNKKPVQVFLDTIETTFPSDVTPPSRVVQVREKRPAGVTSFAMRDRPTSNVPIAAATATASGLTTWPLKNKINSNGKVNKRLTTPSTVGSVNDAVCDAKFDNITDPVTMRVNNSESGESPIDDEVAREEERLINALMTGSVIPEEPSIASRSATASSSMVNADNNQSTIAGNNSSNVRQKPAVKKDKPKVEPIKPIILAPGSLQQIPGPNLESRTLTKEDLSALSAVDYAKIRYRAAQQQNPGAAEKRPNPLQQEQIRKIVDGIGGGNGAIEVSEDRRDNTNLHHHLHHHHHHLHHHRHANRHNQNKNNNNNNEEDHADDEDEEEVGAKNNGVRSNGTTRRQDRTVSAARIKFEFANTPDVDVDNEHLRLDQVSSSSLSTDNKSVGGTSRWGPRVNSTPCRPRLEQLVPHPELTTQQRQHIRAAAATGSGSNPVRPFLTRGSVAERVLIFEKCPSELLLDKRGPRQPAIVTWRTGHEVLSKAQSYARERTQPQKNLPPHTTLQRHVKANRNVLIPRFYFPGGKPIPTRQLDATLSRISAAFQSLPGLRAAKAQFHIIAKACDCPLYWKVPLFLASGGDKNGFVDQTTFIEFWKKWTAENHDASSRFVAMITRGSRDFIVPEDLIPLVQDVVETHPGLTFLKEAKEFHSRYVHTVVARIFYSVNRSWSGKITVAELRRSNLLAVIFILEHEEDINQVTAYFSYEHFYVIYCKFWELDLDHDLFIDSLDLTRHNDNALSTRMIERIFSGAVTRGGVRTSGMGQNNLKDNLQSNSRSIKGSGEVGGGIEEDAVDEEATTTTMMMMMDELDQDKRQRNAASCQNNNQNQRGSLKSEENKMSYTEFVWFLLSEEDKNHPTAIEYWFRCMDLDGDGYLSMYELEYFYEEQLHRMEAIGIETLPFEDCLCQMLDMIRPTIPGKISLSDLKRCKMTSIFFDTFFNLEKYLDHEQRDPFASARDHDANGHELSDWDRFAAEEYELLVAEEGGNEQKEQMSYESSIEDGTNETTIPDIITEIITNSRNGETHSLLSDVAAIIPNRGLTTTTTTTPTMNTNCESSDSDDYADSDD